MANIFRLPGNGNKQYLFKKGKFSIQPTINNFELRNGELFYGPYGHNNINPILKIPFDKPGYIIFIKYYWEYNYTSFYINNGSAEFNNGANVGNNMLQIRGVESYSTFSIRISNNYYQQSLRIKEIWVEKIPATTK